MSATMENFCAEVLPHMVSDGETHIHDLDETMYGGTLTVKDKEVSYGEVVFGKPDVFFAPIPHMFPLSGNDGKSNMFANAVKWSFPFLNKVRRMRSIDKLVAGTTDISQLQKDVVRDSKGMKGHLNLTYNDVKENEEPKVQSEVGTREEPPVKPANEENSDKVDERPDDTKDSLFSGKDDVVNESDYFGSENESDLACDMGSPVFTVKKPLPSTREEVKDESVCDTSNEVIAPTQMRESSDPISTVGLVEVDNLSSPVIPSGQVPAQETTVTAEEANAMDSSQDADDNIVCPDNAASPNTSKPDEDQIMDTVNAPQDESTINEEDAVPQTMNSSGIDSNVLSSPSPSSLLHEHDKHVGEGDTISGDVPEKEHGDDNVIYNQEVIKLNKDLNLERDIGSDCVIQAKGQSKLVVSVQSDLEKMRLVQKLFREAAACKGWSSELTRIPLVELEKCDVELITEKNYTRYVGTIDGNLDVYLQGGEGSEPYIGDSQEEDQSANAALNQPMDENDGPSLENLSQIPQRVPAVTPQPQIVHDAVKPVKPQTAWKRTSNTSKLSKKQKVTHHDDMQPSEPQQKQSKKNAERKSPPIKKEKSAGKKSAKVKQEAMQVKPSTSGIPKQTKSKKSAKSKISSVGDDEDSGELLLESLMRTEKMEEDDSNREEFSMLCFVICNVLLK